MLLTLMTAARLQGIPARKQWRAGKSGDRPEGLRNHLQREFKAAAPDRKWVTDITYIRTGEGWLYLSAVIDLYSKMVIGWSMSQTMDRHLVIQAVVVALWQKQHTQPVILHSDRGSQFTSHEYQLFLKDDNIVSSMSGVGSCYDNAVAESFFGYLKRERVNRRRYQTRSEARTDVFDYIKRLYNPLKKRKTNDQPETNLNVLN